MWVVFLNRNRTVPELQTVFVYRNILMHRSMSSITEGDDDVDGVVDDDEAMTDSFMTADDTSLAGDTFPECFVRPTRERADSDVHATRRQIFLQSKKIGKQSVRWDTFCISRVLSCSFSAHDNKRRYTRTQHN